MPDGTTPFVKMIPIDSITVVNPRIRNKKVFKEIIENISEIGLKKPITVARRDTPEGPHYDLVCGQGRLEAFQNLGQTEIPAIIVDAGSEGCLVMSLVENLARRQHRAIDLLHDIEGLKHRGYAEEEIAEKTGLTLEYTRAVIRLFEKGELRLPPCRGIRAYTRQCRDRHRGHRRRRRPTSAATSLREQTAAGPETRRRQAVDRAAPPKGQRAKK